MARRLKFWNRDRASAAPIRMITTNTRRRTTRSRVWAARETPPSPMRAATPRPPRPMTRRSTRKATITATAIVMMAETASLDSEIAARFTECVFAPST